MLSDEFYNHADLSQDEIFKSLHSPGNDGVIFGLKGISVPGAILVNEGAVGVGSSFINYSSQSALLQNNDSFDVCNTIYVDGSGVLRNKVDIGTLPRISEVDGLLLYAVYFNAGSLLASRIVDLRIRAHGFYTFIWTHKLTWQDKSVAYQRIDITDVFGWNVSDIDLSLKMYLVGNMQNESEGDLNSFGSQIENIPTNRGTGTGGVYAHKLSTGPPLYNFGGDFMQLVQAYKSDAIPWVHTGTPSITDFTGHFLFEVSAHWTTIETTIINVQGVYLL